MNPDSGERNESVCWACGLAVHPFAEFPTPVLHALMDHFDAWDILAAECAMNQAEAICPHKPGGREYWDEQIWRLRDALFRLQHPKDPNPLPRMRLFSLTSTHQ